MKAQEAKRLTKLNKDKAAARHREQNKMVRAEIERRIGQRVAIGEFSLSYTLPVSDIDSNAERLAALVEELEADQFEVEAFGSRNSLGLQISWKNAPDEK